MMWRNLKEERFCRNAWHKNVLLSWGRKINKKIKVNKLTRFCAKNVLVIKLVHNLGPAWVDCGSQMMIFQFLILLLGIINWKDFFQIKFNRCECDKPVDPTCNTYHEVSDSKFVKEEEFLIRIYNQVEKVKRENQGISTFEYL